MTLGRALGVAAADLYHQAWRLVVLNTLLGLGIVLIVLASVAVRGAFVLAILIGPAIAAVMHCAVTLAQTEDLRLAEALRGLRRHWRRGLVLGSALAAGERPIVFMDEAEVAANVSWQNYERAWDLWKRKVLTTLGVSGA